MTFKVSLLVFCLLPLSLLASAAEFSVSQQNKTFSHKNLMIKKGDVVSFPNKDPFFHNVYSLSEAQSFELGSYPTGVSKQVQFDTVGIVDIECAIHPSMKLTIIVSE